MDSAEATGSRSPIPGDCLQSTTQRTWEGALIRPSIPRGLAGVAFPHCRHVEVRALWFGRSRMDGKAGNLCKTDWVNREFDALVFEVLEGITARNQNQFLIPAGDERQT